MFLAGKKVLVAAIPEQARAKCGQPFGVAALVFGKIAGPRAINMVLTEPARL
jgi:hypothetical protein